MGPQFCRHICTLKHDKASLSQTQEVNSKVGELCHRPRQDVGNYHWDVVQEEEREEDGRQMGGRRRDEPPRNLIYIQDINKRIDG